MSSFVKLPVAAGLVAAGLVAAGSPSFAQATRTWVSGVGDDVNPCSRTAPCKTFAGAISKTLAGGEINCLDPGGYGAVTITKSITLDCTGTLGSILNSGTTGITVNDSLSATPNTAEVIVRGLAIDGAGTTAGINGIRFVSGRSLMLQDVFVQNETGQNGILIEPAAAAEFYAEDVTVVGGATGIRLQPTGAGGTLQATLRNVRSHDNTQSGLFVNARVTATVDHSAFSGNANGIYVSATAANPGTVLLNHSVVSGNGTVGLRAVGASARIRVADSVITGNMLGIGPQSGGIINSYGNNRLDGNTTDGAFTAPAIPQQ